MVPNVAWNVMVEHRVVKRAQSDLGRRGCTVLIMLGDDGQEGNRPPVYPGKPDTGTRNRPMGPDPKGTPSPGRPKPVDPRPTPKQR
jgi:hypothetical protein